MGEQRNLGSEKHSGLRERAVLPRDRYCRKPHGNLSYDGARQEWRMRVVA